MWPRVPSGATNHDPFDHPTRDAEARSRTRVNDPRNERVDPGMKNGEIVLDARRGFLLRCMFHQSLASVRRHNWPRRHSSSK
jgi:hypothetical protein